MKINLPIFIFFLTVFFSITPMERQIISSKHKSLLDVIYQRREQPLDNPRYNIVYLCSKEELNKKTIYGKLEKYPKTYPIEDHMALLSYCNEDTFKLEIFDGKKEKWQTALFLSKGIDDDHFLPYSHTNKLYSIKTVVCLFGKSSEDIALWWKAVEYVKQHNVSCVYMMDQNTQYDFDNSDAFTHPRKPIEKTKIETKYVLFGPNTADTLIKMTAIFCVFAVPCITLYKMVQLFTH